MAEEQEPGRAERRRQDKEAAKGKVKECSECKEGPCDIAPRVFTECPVCHCPNTFTVQSMKGDLHIEDLRGKQSALFAFDYLYDTPNCEVKLTVVGASCARCGVFYTLARSKVKKIPLVVPPGHKRGGDGPGLILPDQAG